MGAAVGESPRLGRAFPDKPFRRYLPPSYGRGLAVTLDVSPQLCRIVVANDPAGYLPAPIRDALRRRSGGKADECFLSRPRYLLYGRGEFLAGGAVTVAGSA
ncbi:hypothetical protein FMEAI12_2770001 [Parafrankia sp. Ea1.12]|nr:hypothetical protein FMEAI12_2770001 [Parafrankia sp. Ea1.12]